MPLSPQRDGIDDGYEAGWAAISEWIEGDGSWSGRERNVCYLNNRDGTFADISAASGLDFIEDGRSFAFGDLDGDGDLDLAIKSRNSPGLRIVRNDWPAGRSATVRLRGTGSNRDGIGAEVRVRVGGLEIRRTVRAGSGFLSQHAKELHFGLGGRSRAEELRVRWPSGTEQVFPGFPAGMQVTVVEGSGQLRLKRLAAGRAEGSQDGPATDQFGGTTAERGNGTWLVGPVPAPAWDLKALDGSTQTLEQHGSSALLLNIWASWCPPCRAELRDIQHGLGRLAESGVGVVAISVDEAADEEAVRSIVGAEGLSFPVLLADVRFRAAYTTLVRSLLARRTELGIPTSFLLNGEGLIEKVYLGRVTADQIASDASHIGESAASRLARALPFPGQFFESRPVRDYTRLGAELLDVSLPDLAVPYLRKAIQQRPSLGSAHYDLGTAYAATAQLETARRSFETAISLSPEHAQAHNSLGVVLGRMGRHGDAAERFRKALAVQPNYPKAIANLASALERAGDAALAADTLERGALANPRDTGLVNRLGSLLARTGDLTRAGAWFKEALARSGEDPETLTNLALLEAQKGNLNTAEEQLLDLIDNHGRHAAAHIALARVQIALGNIEGARATLAELVEREPTHETARQLLASLSE